MKQAYIESYKNDNGDVVINYIGDASFGNEPELQTIVLTTEDCKSFIKAIKSACNEAE